MNDSAAKSESPKQFKKVDSAKMFDDEKARDTKYNTLLSGEVQVLKKPSTVVASIRP
jgi:hypothetical protein